VTGAGAAEAERDPPAASIATLELRDGGVNPGASVVALTAGVEAAGSPPAADAPAALVSSGTSESVASRAITPSSPPLSRTLLRTLLVTVASSSKPPTDSCADAMLSEREVDSAESGCTPAAAAVAAAAAAAAAAAVASASLPPPNECPRRTTRSLDALRVNTGTSRGRVALRSDGGMLLPPGVAPAPPPALLAGEPGRGAGAGRSMRARTLSRSAYTTSAAPHTPPARRASSRWPGTNGRV
jgi:hypothetical protein